MSVDDDGGATPGKAADLAVSTDPITGEVVGGLKGLRQLIKAKSELNAQSTKPTTGLEPNKQRKSSRQSDDNLANSNTNKEELDSSKATHELNQKQQQRVRLLEGIKPDDILYGETSKNTALFFLRRGNLVYRYSDDLFPDADRLKFVREAYRLFRQNSRLYWFDDSKDQRIRLYLNKKGDVRLTASGLAWGNKYLLVSSDNPNFARANKLIHIQDIKSNRTNLIGKESLAANHNKSSLSMADRIVKVQEIIKVSGSDPTSEQAGQIIILLGEASIGLLQKVLEIDHVKAETLIDSLRLKRVLGAPDDDGHYSIAISNIDEVAKMVNDSENGDFDSLIKQINLGQNKLVYDLNNIGSVLVAEEFMDLLAHYTKATDNEKIKKLLSDESKPISASGLMELVGHGLDHGLDNIDFMRFHLCVTKNLLMNNRFDYIIPILSGAGGASSLRADVARYIISNFDWISANNQPIQLTKYIKNYKSIDSKDLLNNEPDLINKICNLVSKLGKNNTRKVIKSKDDKIA